ncbi:hypothetical protein Trydic_g7221 [Trypoxylus dichotomus]
MEEKEIERALTNKGFKAKRVMNLKQRDNSASSVFMITVPCTEIEVIYKVADICRMRVTVTPFKMRQLRRFTSRNVPPMSCVQETDKPTTCERDTAGYETKVDPITEPQGELPTTDLRETKVSSTQSARKCTQKRNDSKVQKSSPELAKPMKPTETKGERVSSKKKQRTPKKEQ